MKKVYLLLFILSIGSIPAFSQATTDTTALFTGKPDTLPSFTGGQPAWIKFLQQNLHAEVPVDNGAGPGKYVAVISFIVGADGMLSDLKIDKNPGKGTGEEALRLMKLSPKWQPAIYGGRAVKYRYARQIIFEVSNG